MVSVRISTTVTDQFKRQVPSPIQQSDFIPTGHRNVPAVRTCRIDAAVPDHRGGILASRPTIAADETNTACSCRKSDIPRIIPDVIIDPAVADLGVTLATEAGSYFNIARRLEADRSAVSPVTIKTAVSDLSIVLRP